MKAALRIAQLLAPLAVLLVAHRAGGDAPAGQFSVGTQTALDTKTGLRWQRVGSDGMPWATALQTCSTVQLDGQGGFRLPTVRELESIYDVRAPTGPNWDKSVFSAASASIGAGTEWASNDDATSAYVVSFIPTTGIYMGTQQKTDYAGARCVKGP